MFPQTSPLEPPSSPSPCTPSFPAPEGTPEPTQAANDPTRDGKRQLYVSTDIGNVRRSDKLAEVEVFILIDITHGHKLEHLIHRKLCLLDKTNRLFMSDKTVLVRILSVNRHG